MKNAMPMRIAQMRNISAGSSRIVEGLTGFSSKIKKPAIVLPTPKREAFVCHQCTVAFAD